MAVQLDRVRAGRVRDSRRRGRPWCPPALTELLAEPGGEDFRLRLPGRAGLVQPTELLHYGGVEDLAPTGARTYSVGDDCEMPYGNANTTDDEVLGGLLVLGVAALLVPVVVFVVSTTRSAETTRERRLATLRLLGATAAQVRRSAAAHGDRTGWDPLRFDIAVVLALIATVPCPRCGGRRVPGSPRRE